MLNISLVSSQPNTNQIKTKFEKLKSKNTLNDEYLIDTGDVLSIKIEDAQELSNSYEVLNDGTINIPLVGKINLRGLSLQNTEEVIKKHLSKQLIYPIVYVRIAKTRPIKYIVIGEVNNPGLYTSKSEETDYYPTIVDGIRNAGGITNKSNLAKVKLKRKLAGNNSEYKKTDLDLIDLIFKGNHSQNPYLFDGDIIEINKIKQSNIVENEFNVALNNLSPQEIEINIIGAVNNPGRMTAKSPITLNQAILNAGGPISWKSNKGNVQILRVNRNGSVSLKKFRINLKNDISDNNPILVNNDIIRVRKSTLGNVTDGLSAVSQPFRDILSFYSIFKIIED